MFELNEQELEQVAGGRKLSTSGFAGGDANALLGGAISSSSSASVATSHFTMSQTENDSAAAGLVIDASSVAGTSASSKSW